jgi:hypothetical protein
MTRLKEVAKFGCGAEAFHTLIHAYFDSSRHLCMAAARRSPAPQGVPMSKGRLAKPQHVSNRSSAAIAKWQRTRVAEMVAFARRTER